ncbi:hypothetical protein GGTG_10903 [Gaeumannomyces tritici R3-111a-1]|uniref:Uncharacterized protein n=1 Tax=Gaeumannomyces tritici (strain R3-111a-1) TaxID=644352 RepID=J3PBN1_GAET3|nr:hypothetical protein GGTG_10903 [Gaeumannomyces tritici R3-111a-1]EJT71648.1 hypothetical protein GGTG_10903 [Gaeumannomyces tritici R3-111a-1]
MSQSTKARLGSFQNGSGAPKYAHPKREEPPQLKPLIAEILDSQDCISGSVFLVEKIDTVTQPIAAPRQIFAPRPSHHGATRKRRRRRSRHLRAVRLLLADGGGVCIQGLLRPAAHDLVYKGSVYEGCFVRLDDFWLRVVQPDASSPETRPTVFLVLEVVTPLSKPRPRPAVKQSTAADDELTTPQRRASVATLKPPAATAGQKQGLKQPFPVAGFLSAATIRDAPPVLAAAEAPDFGGPTDGGPRQHSHNSTSNQGHEKPASGAKAPGATVARRPQAPAEPDSSRLGTPPAWACHDLSHPLKLTPLRAIPLLPFKQNWMVNVLAVVAELSGPEPSLLPPSYAQRTARLADPSTPKHVLLTVFLDPDGFAPSPGAAVLLLGVKNHRFDGGSLKKYASDRPRDGGPWWLEAPRHLPWCDVAGLEAWWAAMAEEEKEEGRSRQEDG